MWFLFGVFSLLAVFPLFWVPAGVLAVFCVLVFQVFTYEPELSPIGCVKKSMQLVKGHFASTFMLMALVGALTYVFVPQIANKLFEVIKGTKNSMQWKKALKYGGISAGVMGALTIAYKMLTSKKSV